MKPQALNQKGKFVFELKQRIIISLNKLSDRDTYQLGSEELERIADSLSPDMISPFLFCIADMDSEAKSSVRRECIRLMGVLGISHGALLGPHMAKIVSGIVKRLKDSDSVVRDACVETCGVLSRNVEGVFVTLARPLFEALGEQNKYVQGGGALCLARVIDESVDLPSGILPQMLSRLVKLLKNQHFMAKPALIELIRSIIQAGGASTDSSLLIALTGIIDCLKNHDWTTRKAASSALSSIALSCDSYMLGPLASSCLHSLERCRFDKVKPVRDAITHAIQCWKSISGDNSLEISEVASSVKENFCSDYTEVTSISDNGSKSTSFRKPVSISNSHTNANMVSFPKGNKNAANQTKKRTPLSLRKPDNVIPNTKPVEWQIEVAVPKKKTILSSPVVQKDVKEHVKEEEYSDMGSGSCVTKDIKIEGGECNSKMNFDLDGFSDRFLDEDGDAEIEVESTHTLLQDKKGSDLSACGPHVCCANAKNELGFIRKQLEEIELKQNNLFDVLKEFVGSSMDNFTTLHSKIYKMENAVNQIVSVMTQKELNFVHGNPSPRLAKNGNISISSSPRISYSSPRSSTETIYKNPLHTKSTKLFPENTRFGNETSSSIAMGPQNDPGRLSADSFTKRVNRFSGTGDAPVKSEKSSAKCTQSDSERSKSDLGKHFNGFLDALSHAIPTKDDKLMPEGGPFETECLSATAIGTPGDPRRINPDSFEKQVYELLTEGDMESAYIMVLCSGDDLSIIGLMDVTGPVLHKLSSETASEVLRVMSVQPMDRKFLEFAIPWIQQVVDLSTAEDSRQLFLSPRAKREFLHSLQQVVTTATIDATTRLAIAQHAARLGKAFGLVSTRKLPPRDTRVAKNFISHGS
ncbi:ARM repeat superfamily protein [Rhynchospora pubera]|uniref:ARM repeat superfamily protein n=1 Tax=Rhynchospora pubera TaxID=906938 RepID=A0AAV8F4J3_9POAL|nr:ARM repeat superfamily protein [Rhynchospora pubera]